MSTISSTDRIEKQILLKAPRARVWRALANAEEFGDWFGVRLHGPIAAGGRVTGKVTTPGYEDLVFEITDIELEPERRIAWRWHPSAIEPGVDYSKEPKTLIVFTLEDVAGGTRLTMVETGFDALPPERRAQAYRGNDGGWTEQMKSIDKHVSRAV
jgi:uncharacterized protein YndB with AHSA1/START domain